MRRGSLSSKLAGAALVAAVASGTVAAAYAGDLFSSASPAQLAFSAPSTAQSAVAGRGTVVPHTVTAQLYDTAPAPPQGERPLTEPAVPAPNRVTAPAQGNPGPPVPPPDSSGPLAADATYQRLANPRLPTTSIPGGQSFSSFYGDPSVADSGTRVFMTGDWYAAASGDRGSTWKFLDPNTLFGSGFCCAQVAAYDKTHDRMFWLLQYNDHFVIANAPSNKLQSWCYYNFSPGMIGQANTTQLDFGDLMIGTKDLYFTVNIFPTSGFGSEIVRLPLEQLSTCSGFSFNYFSQFDSFNWRLVQGSDDRAYWGSDWDPTGVRPNGSSFRLFWWDESSGQLFWNNYTINAFPFYVRNAGENCGSQDGVVKNWCQFSDSRVLGAYRANGVIGFSMNAMQGGFAAFPYTVREYFKESDLSYTGNTNLYSTTFAIQDLALAPNSRGHVGGAYAWGGGTGTTHYYPGSATMVEDDITPGQPWTNDFWQAGNGNTCTYGGLYRWVDYMTARANDAADTTWVGTGVREVGNCGATGAYTQPALMFFGRARDVAEFARWR